MCQISEIFAYLYGSKHTFIYNVATRKRHDIEIFVMYSFLNLFTDNVKRTFQLQAVRIAGNEHLFDVGFCV